MIDKLDSRSAHVSIHAPAWGATMDKIDWKVACVFQFTLPRGERLSQSCLNSCAVKVSIHAPAWGATNNISFQILDTMFQFTLPRGERLQMLLT